MLFTLDIVNRTANCVTIRNHCWGALREASRVNNIGRFSFALARVRLEITGAQCPGYLVLAA